MSTTVPSGQLHQRLGPLAASRRVFADVNPANLAAGITAGLWYAFGAIPVLLGVQASLGVRPEAATSWFFITFFTSAVTSLALTLRFKQPVPFGWSIPALLLIGTAGSAYSLPEIAGACLAAGVLIVVLGLLGIGELLMRSVPLPIVMGMLAGNLLGYTTRVFEDFGTQPQLVGAALLGYLLARRLGRTWLPPVAGAVLFGLAAAIVTGQVHPERFQWEPPVLQLISPSFNASSFPALSLPLAVIVIAGGNVQAFGFLASQGFRPPINLLTTVVGINTVVHALFGGHPSSIQRNGAALVGGEEAGPQEQRYVANLIASLCTLGIAFSAATASSLLGVLPGVLVAALAGLAVLSTVLDALKKTITSELPLSAFFALAIAASPLTLFGIGSTFWALVGGLLVWLLLRPASVAGRPAAA